MGASTSSISVRLMSYNRRVRGLMEAPPYGTAELITLFKTTAILEEKEEDGAHRGDH